MVLQTIIKIGRCDSVSADVYLKEHINLGYSSISNIFQIAGLLGNYTIDILNADGTVHESIETTGHFHTIDLTALPPGMYLISIQSNENVNVAYVTIIKF